MGLGAGVYLLLAAGMAGAQGSCTFTDENGKTVTWVNCQPPANAKDSTTKGSTPAAPVPGTSPAKSFPFPGETPAAVPGTPAAAATPGQNAGGSPAGSAGTSNAPAGRRFPFPGEDSSAGDAAKSGASTPDGGAAAGNGDVQDAGSSGGASSSSSSSGADAGPLGEDDDPAARAAESRKAERKRLAKGPRQTPDDREMEDLKVAAFYQNDGNYKGAYDRAADAVALAGDDADAHLALAEAARRLGKLDEAEGHYKKSLTLDPVPKTQ
jgi:hypothetical protein